MSKIPWSREIAKYEDDGRVLIVYATEGGGLILANEYDVARQSVVLSQNEVRWLAAWWRGDSDIPDAVFEQANREYEREHPELFGSPAAEETR